VALGYVFSDQLERVAAQVERMGAFVALAAASAFSFYLGWRFAHWRRFVRQFKLARITPEQLKDKLNRGDDILIVDLQYPVDHSAELMAIPGAVRINPRRLEQYSDIEISPSREVVLYCARPGDFTSARVALALREKGVNHVRPLDGGLQAWRECAFLLPRRSGFRWIRPQATESVDDTSAHMPYGVQHSSCLPISTPPHICLSF
jgi:rhodanese-related sulfurtransferase